MKKNEIKQIILEEIKSVLSEMGPDLELYPDGLDFPEAGGMSPEEMAADSRPEEDEMDMGMDMDMDLEEMARTPNVFALAREASMRDVLQFMQRVNDKLKTYKSPGQKKPKKRFTPEEMKALAVAMVNPEGFTSKDIIAATSYNSPAQANKFLAALEQKGLIKLISQLKKAMDTPAKPEAAPDVDDFEADIDMSDFEDLDLSDPFSEAIKRQVSKLMKEAKSPLAKKMKEVESRGRIAALETKLAAVQEMIEETEGRLTRIDEDNEFADMMDKSAVKEVRKQLKELERAQAKLQKEYDRVSGGRKRNTVVDEEEKSFDEKTPEEMSPEDTKNLALSQAGIPEEVELNEISNNTVISAIRQALQRGEFKRAESLSNGLFKDFIGKNAGPNLGVLKGVKVNPVRDLGNLAGESIKGMFESVQFNFENPNVSGQSGRTQILLKGMDQNDGTMKYSNSGSASPIEELELTRQEVRFIQKMILFIDPTNTKWTKGTSGYNVAGLRESILRMQKLAGLIKG